MCPEFLLVLYIYKMYVCGTVAFNCSEQFLTPCRTNTILVLHIVAKHELNYSMCSTMESALIPFPAEQDQAMNTREEDKMGTRKKLHLWYMGTLEAFKCSWRNARGNNSHEIISLSSDQNIQLSGPTTHYKVLLISSLSMVSLVTGIIRNKNTIMKGHPLKLLNTKILKYSSSRALL